jgi:guanylate kinase
MSFRSMKGKSVIFSAPSGSGKTTIVRHLLGLDLRLEFSVSACSREPRKNEVHGKDYYFLSVEEFRKNIDAGNFVEWEEVYANMYYGTLKSELERIWSSGNHVIFDVDVVGGSNLKKILGPDALGIFIRPPSMEVLEQRLRDRSTDSEEKIRTRLAKASEELGYSKEFDLVLVNDQLESTLSEAEASIRKFLRN